MPDKADEGWRYVGLGALVAGAAWGLSKLLRRPVGAEPPLEPAPTPEPAPPTRGIAEGEAIEVGYRVI